MVTVETKGFNQRGEEVCFFRRKVMVWKTAARPATPASLRGRRLGLSTGAPPTRPAGGRSRSTAQVRGARVEAIGGIGWGTAVGGGSRRPELPWRSTRDPWAVLVSEVMAQQTQVARVVPAYRRFLERFPTPASCAAAPLGDVLRAWQGLGYNRRAANLHRAASVVVADHGGRVPADLGCAAGAARASGAYTARAVLAFAFEADVGVVDTNAGRVLSRAVAGRPVGAAEAQRLVDAMVPRRARLGVRPGPPRPRGRRSVWPVRPGAGSARSAGAAGGRPRGRSLPDPARVGRGLDAPGRLRRLGPAGPGAT